VIREISFWGDNFKLTGVYILKKTLFFIIAVFLSSASLYADDNASKIVIPREKNVFTNPSDNEFIGKLGTSYASKPGKFGMDLSLNYIYNIDPVFVFGLEGDFFWIKWKTKVGEVKKGSAEGDLTANTDLFTFPCFANAQIRFPFLREKIYVEPAVTVGLGYCFMILDYSYSSKEEIDLYGGFAWQFFGSAYYKIYQNSAVDFVLDLGYRSLSPEKNNVQFDMSGIIARIGVRMYI